MFLVGLLLGWWVAYVVMGIPCNVLGAVVQNLKKNNSECKDAESGTVNGGN